MIKRSFTLNFLISCIFSGLSALILMAVVLQSCNDESYQIGLELLPEQDDIDVEQIDTLTFETYNIGPAGIPVYDSIHLPFGIYNDPVFGQTKAGLMLEFSPANYYIRINEGVVVDTVIMNIYYDTIYGVQDYLPQIEVFALTTGIDKSTRYFTDFNKTGTYDPNNLSVSGTEKPDTTNRLSIRLDNDLGYSLLAMEELNDSILFTSYKIDSIFDDHFKGLYLNPVPGGNDKSLIDFYNISLTVSFHTEADTSVSISFAFYPTDTRYLTVDGKSVPMGDKMIKIFEHDYSGSAITHLNDSTFHDTVMYLQSLGGAQAVLNISSLEQLRQKVGRVSVNSAQLFIPALNDSALLVDNFYPSQLGMRILDDAVYYLPDDVLYQPSQYASAFSYMNGTFSGIDWGYHFNLTSYFHEYMKGDINSSRLLIFAGRLDAILRRTNFNPINYNSVVLAGSSNINRKITLKVAYTKL
jgi:hypothetical protein